MALDLHYSAIVILISYFLFNCDVNAEAQSIFRNYFSSVIFGKVCISEKLILHTLHASFWVDELVLSRYSIKQGYGNRAVSVVGAFL